MGTMVLPFLAIYMTKVIGVDAGSAGLILFFYGLGALVSAPFVGRLSDKLGQPKVMILSLFSSAAVFILFPFIKDYYAIIAATFLLAIASEAFRPAAMSFIANESKPNQRKTSFALIRLAINLGMSIGPVVAGFLVLMDFSLIFYVDAITAILAGIFLLLTPIELTAESAEHDHHEKKLKVHSHVFKDLNYIYFLIAIVPVSMVYFQHMSSFAIYLVNDLKYLESTFGALIAVNTGLIILFEVPLNSAMEHWNDKKSILLGALLTGIGFGAIVFASNVVLLIGTIIIWTFGEMIFFPAVSSFVSNLAPRKKSGEYMGYFQMTFSIAFMLGPWAGTEVLENLGSNVLWIGALGVCLISILLILGVKIYHTKPVKAD
jgi:MFS family permease